MHGNATGGGDQFFELVRHILVKEKRDIISSLASAMGVSPRGATMLALSAACVSGRMRSTS